MAKGNITGEVFDDGVIDQIDTRQRILGQRYKDDKTLIFSNNQTAFLRLASSINIGDTTTSIFETKNDEFAKLNVDQQQAELSKGAIQIDTDKDGKGDTYSREVENNNIEEGKNQLKQRKLDENMSGMKLAQACVLFGGVTGVDDNLNPTQKFGVYDQPSTSEKFNFDSIAAYGWGGLGKKGYVPMPAIDNAKVSFYNRGAIQKADIRLKVYSLEQLQIFDLLYFRIGYSMLLEWGHNVWMDNEGELKNRNDFVTKPFEKFFTEGTSQQDIFKSIQAQRKSESHNYDAMLGKVTNFNWKFNDDGTYDITLKLIGMGDIIESLKVNKAPLATNGDSLTPSEAIKKQETNAGNIEKAASNNTKAAQDKLSKLKESKQKDLDALQKRIDAEKSKISAVFKLVPAPKPPANSGLSGSGQRIRPSDWKNRLIDTTVFGKKINQYGGTGFSNRSIIEVRNYRNANRGSKGTLIGFQFTISDNDETNDSTLSRINEKKKELNDKLIFIKDSKQIISKRFTGKIEDALSTIFNIISKASNSKVKEIEKLEKEVENVEAQSERQKQAANAIREKVQKRKDTLALAPETSLETKNKSLFNQQLVLWRNEAKNGAGKGNLYKLNFESNDTDSNNSGVSKLSLDFYYVRLGFLLKWIEENLLVYDTTKADPDNKELPNPIFKINYGERFKEGKLIEGTEDRNFCLRFPGQHSSDPRVCLIPSQYEQGASKWDILPDLNNYFVDDKEGAGRLMNIMVNIDNTASILDANIDSNGKVNLNKFLTGLLSEINDCLGNVNKLEPVFDTEENELTIIDANNIPGVDKIISNENKKRSKMGVFNVYGIGTKDIPNGSFVTNIDFQVQLPPNMAAMATISAQANGNIVGENATGLSRLNTGLTDRLNPVKLDADSIEGSKAGKDDPSKIFSKTLELVNKSIQVLYVEKQFVKATVSSMRSNNRDIALYITGNEEYLDNAPPPFFIPFNLKVDMQGLSGMRNYERFSITEEVLPYSYRSGGQGGKINFLIKGVSHKIDNNEWTTSIESLSVGALKPE